MSFLSLQAGCFLGVRREVGMHTGKATWRMLGEYFRRVSLCKSRQEFLHVACVEIQPIIPFDETAGVFDRPWPKKPGRDREK